MPGSSTSTCLSQALQNPRLPGNKVQVRQESFLGAAPTPVFLVKPSAGFPVLCPSLPLPAPLLPYSPRLEASFPFLRGFLGLVPLHTGPGHKLVCELTQLPGKNLRH